MSLTEKIFFWAPRVLSIGFVLFLSLFALDVFSEYTGFGVLLPLLIHLIPSLILLVAVAIAWRYDLFGAIIFIGFALWYVWSAGFGRPWSWYAGIAAPAFIVGVLYVISWFQKKSRGKTKLESS